MISREPAGLSTARGAFSGNGRPKFLLDEPLFALRYGKICDNSHLISHILRDNSEITARQTAMAMDDKTRTELEAAVFRRLVEHLRSRSDVQNIDLMNLAGFCRNCLSNWLKEEADAKGTAMSKDESREAVYGMPYETWKSTYQGTRQSRATRGDEKGPERALSSSICMTVGLDDHGLIRSETADMLSPVGALWMSAMLP